MSQRYLTEEVNKFNFLLALTEQLQTANNIKDIAELSLNYLVEVMRCDFGDIKMIKSKDKNIYTETVISYCSANFVAICGQKVTEEMKSFLSQSIPYKQGVIWQVVETGKPLLIKNYAEHPNALPIFSHPAIGEVIFFPIIDSQEKTIAILTLENRSIPEISQKIQPDLIVVACRIIGLCLEKIQFKEKLQYLNKNLDTLIKKRTLDLESANQELESFSYSLVHDLRAPVRHIYSFVKLIEKRLKQGKTIDDPEVNDYFNIVENSHKKIEKIIDSLLILSSLSKKSFTSELVDFNKLVKNIINYHQEEIKAENRQIEWLVSELPIIKGDPNLLQLLWQNLISNAVKFTKKSAPARIDIGFSDEIFYIKDNGVGFNMAYQHKLFEPLERLHSEFEFSGTGIGLSIVKRIIEHHNGNIWAEARKNVGATFFFKLNRSS